MDPFFARNRLSAYLDGALDDAEAAEVAAAMEADPTLRSEYEELERAVELLRTHGPTEAPPGFHARLMARVDAEPNQGGVVAWFKRSFAQVPVEALALVAAALVVVVVIQGRPGEDPVSALEGAKVAETAAAQQTAKVASPAAGASEEPDRAEADLDRIAQTTLPGEAQLGSPAEKAAPSYEAPSSGSYAAKPSSSKAVVTKSGASGSGVDGSYQPEWETQGLELETQAPAGGEQAEGEASGLTRPSGYRISLGHPQTLYDLQTIAQQAGGRLTDSKGQALVPRALTYEDNYVLAFIAVPAKQGSTVDSALRKQLRASPMPAPSGSPMYTANQAGFVIEVHYMP